MEVVFILVLVAAVAVVLIMWRSVGRYPSAERFLETHELPPTTDALWLAHTFLWRERWWRLLGAWSGFLVVSGYQLALTERVNTIGIPHLAGIVAGSAVGVAWAARPPRRDEGTTREASLTVRSVDDYLPRRARTLELAAAATLTLATGTTAVIAIVRDAPQAAVTATICCAASAAAFGLIRTLQRRVVEAGRPALDDVLAATDDARRSSTVQSLHHALLAGLACTAIFATGATTALLHPIDVRFDGKLIERIEGSDLSWNAAPTPEGGVVLWTSDAAVDRHVTIDPPAGAERSGRPVDPSRWTVDGASGGLLMAGNSTGTLTSNEGLVVVILALVITALVQWSRIRRAPDQPMLRRPGPRRPSSDLVTADPVAPPAAT